MTTYLTVIRKSDGAEFEAIRYGGAHGVWEGNHTLTELAAFVLGMNPDVSTSVANERMLDVVRPLLDNFDPASNRADVLVQLGVGGQFLLSLGNWVLRHRATSATKKVSNDEFLLGYDIAQPVEVESLFDQLTDFIYSSFQTLEGDLYHALAENIAAQLIAHNWINKEKT